MNERATPKHDYMQSALMDKNCLRRIFPQLKDTSDNKINIRIEVPLYKTDPRMEMKGYSDSRIDIVGYWDIVIDCEYPRPEPKEHWSDTIRERMSIEIKPSILSLGHAVRQINKYCFYDRKGDRDRFEISEVYLFTFDLRYKAQFESQGIGVINAGEFIEEWKPDGGGVKL